MSDFESKLKEENETIKKIFNFNGDETQLQNLTEVLINYFKNSKNDLNFFITFVDFYSKCRPNQQFVSKELIEFVHCYFHGQFNEIQESIRTKFIKFIIFPEELLFVENQPLQEMFLLLEKDDIDEFISFLSTGPTIDITKKQIIERKGYYYYLFNCNWNYSYYISLIDFCCFFGSLKCFKYLLLNKCEITQDGYFNTLKYSIAGGNK